MAIGLLVMGLAASVYLVQEHYVACHDPGQAICDIDEFVSCSKVALSPYAVFWGLPVAVWGVLGYLAMTAVSLWGYYSRGARPAVAALGVLAGFSAVTSLVLGVISKTIIGAVCLFCIATYVVNAVLLVPALLLLVWSGPARAFAEAFALVVDARGRIIPAALVGAGALLLLMWKYPKYWVRVQSHAAEIEAEVIVPPAASGKSDPGFTTGVTEDGHHWIGAREPQVVVEEYSDYQCPYCRLAHARLRELTQKYPGVIRLVHRNFPLDNACNPIIPEPFHPAACFYSGLVVCAGEQERFWPANDYVFEHGHDAKPIKPGTFARDLGLDEKQLVDCLDKRAWDAIRPDLEKGIELKIQGTPTFVVNGKMALGADPRQLLAPYLPKEALREPGPAPSPSAVVPAGIDVQPAAK